MGDLFGSSTLPGWKFYTPATYQLEAAGANAEIGKSFASAYQGAQRQKLGQQELDQRQRQFQDKMIEDKRQFDIMHPDPTKPWAQPETPPPGTPPAAVPGLQSWQGGTPAAPGWRDTNIGMFNMSGFYQNGGRPPVGEPAVVGEDGPEVFVPEDEEKPRQFVPLRPGTIAPADGSAPTVVGRNGPEVIVPTRPGEIVPAGQEMGAFDAGRLAGLKRARDSAAVEAASAWMTNAPKNWRATNALDAISKVGEAKSYAELSEFQRQNPEAALYPQVQSALHDKSTMIDRAERLDIARQRAANNSIAQRNILAGNNQFLKELGMLPPEDQAVIRNMDPNPKTEGPSNAQLFALAEAKQRIAGVRSKEAEEAGLVWGGGYNLDGSKKYVLPHTGAGMNVPGSTWEARTFKDEAGKPVFTGLVQVAKDGTILRIQHSDALTERVPLEVKAQQMNNKTAQEAATDEVKLRLKALDDARPAQKKAAEEALTNAKTRLENLQKEAVVLSTNWMGRAAAPVAAPVAAAAAAPAEEPGPDQGPPAPPENFFRPVMGNLKAAERGPTKEEIDQKVDEMTARAKAATNAPATKTTTNAPAKKWVAPKLMNKADEAKAKVLFEKALADGADPVELQRRMESMGFKFNTKTNK